MMKRACGASQNWQWREARCSQYLEYWQAERQSVPRRAEQVPSVSCLDATPERDGRAPDARSSYAPARSHPASGPLLNVPARCRLWPQPPAGWRGFGPRLHARRFPGAGPKSGPLFPRRQNRDSAACVSLCYGLLAHSCRPLPIDFPPRKLRAESRAAS